jgi:hypothetical protein
MAGGGIAKHLPRSSPSRGRARSAAAPASPRPAGASAEAAGTIERSALAAALAAVDRPMRQAAAKLGVKIGTLDVYCPALLKPEPVRWRLALSTVFGALDGGAMPEAPPPGAAAVPTPSDAERFEAFARAGYRPLGAQMLRVDLAERLARIAHDGRNGRAAFAPDPGLATSLGLRHPSFVQLMLALGFRPASGEEERSWCGAARVRPAPRRRARGQRLRRAGGPQDRRWLNQACAWTNSSGSSASPGGGPWRRRLRNRAICASTGRVVDRAHAAVRAGNVLSFPMAGRVRVIRIDALPRHRGRHKRPRAAIPTFRPIILTRRDARPSRGRNA